ncbi:MBL fold metallo-hydrolase [Gorillibacterium massiliense]|uniref:MBL fold metallo-hydrolase n=1 Tax=Gorillibacterium massiliense TaxID=1280390 RepID=UPI000593CA76|nr:MBL fold metallo-hydrolase [Gorillibacterium massiliense]
MTDQLLILGTGDSMGVPRVYCECEICDEARTGGSNRRLRSAVRLTSAAGYLWIDCGPDWAEQMEAAEQREMEQALLTHAHFDHMAGLPEWADACRWTGRKGNLYAPEDVLDTVRERYPWLERNLDYHAIGDEWVFGEWRITKHKMCHGKNGFSYAYRLEKPDFVWAYCPDSINLQQEEKAFLSGLDLLILGTSYYHEAADFHTRSVYDMTEAAELLAEIRPGRTLYTHMSHGVDIRADYPLPAQTAMAEKGMTIELRR